MSKVSATTKASGKQTSTTALVRCAMLIIASTRANLDLISARVMVDTRRAMAHIMTAIGTKIRKRAKAKKKELISPFTKAYSNQVSRMDLEKKQCPIALYIVVKCSKDLGLELAH